MVNTIANLIPYNKRTAEKREFIRYFMAADQSARYSTFFIVCSEKWNSVLRIIEMTWI